MNNATITTLKSEIVKEFEESLGQVINKVSEMLESNLQENESDENENCQTQMTLQPKVKIVYSLPGIFSIKVTIPAKRIETIIGESETDFAVDSNGEIQEDPQGELDLKEEEEEY